VKICVSFDLKFLFLKMCLITNSKKLVSVRSFVGLKTKILIEILVGVVFLPLNVFPFSPKKNN
jgi:hypothetical protein